ncbi:MAG: LacI family DNA-binding transcriptional regulator [Planctomycetota bacterium]
MRDRLSDSPANTATVRDIAARAGVSPASVSRALRDPNKVRPKTRIQVERALDELEAGAIHTELKRATTIGCVFFNAAAGLRYSGYDSTIWAGIARAATTHGADVTLVNCENTPPGISVTDVIRSKAIDALVVRVDAESKQVLGELAKLAVPVLVVARAHDLDTLGYVHVKSREASRDAVRHLIELGHSRIAFCRNFVADSDHKDRHNGYIDALQDHDLPRRPGYEITTAADAEGGAAAISRLMSLREPPTAVFFADPLPTVGAIRRCHEIGLHVPKDISIVGVDDENFRRSSHPVYTAVCQDAPAMAERAGRVLLDHVRHNPSGPPPRLTLDGYFEVNASTGPAPRNQ